MAADGTWTQNDRPGNGIWNPRSALTFAEVINWIDMYRSASLPISREMIALFFFHETAFSSVRQSGGGPAVGLGQLEVLNPRSDKPAFLKKLGLKGDHALATRMVADPPFSIQLQCAYYLEKFLMGVTSRGGMLAAQFGANPPNSLMIPHFPKAEEQLRAAIAAGERMAIIDALNACRYYVDAARTGLFHAPVPFQRYQRYWDYTLPTGNLAYALRR